MITRQTLEAREETILAGYAMRSGRSRGRRYAEAEHSYRTAYQRDRDRIIHTTAFRRLEYKTQVFVYSEGDHYRNRLTHSIEVAQIGRTLARGLGSNEDLSEAICLAHDLGHPPFGHEGEHTLDALMQGQGGFNHQRQTYRILTELERRYPDYVGLNLTYEVLEGVVKHDPDFDAHEARHHHPEERGTLECQLANLADEIAYNTSDLDDGLRSGILPPDEVVTLEAVRRVLVSLGEAPTADLRQDILRHRLIRRLIALEVGDVLETTARRIEAANVGTVEEVRGQPANLAGYSDEMQAANQELRRYLFERFYRHYRVVRMATKARRLLGDLFTAYVTVPTQLPSEVQQRLHASSDSLPRLVCDYLAGMTDRYAIQEHKRLFDPEERA